MSKVKIYISLPEELNEKLFFQGLNIEGFFQESGVEIGKDELQLKGKPISRGIITYIVVYIAGYLLRKLLDKISGKALKEAIAIMEKTPKLKSLAQLLKWVLKNEEDRDDDNYILELKPLPKGDDGDKFLLEITNRDDKK